MASVAGLTMAGAGAGAGGNTVVGAGARGGRVDGARGRRGGVATDKRELKPEDGAEGETTGGAVAYGCAEGAMGVRGVKPPDEVDVPRVNIAVPISMSSEVSEISILAVSDELRVPSAECPSSDEGDRGPR